MQNSELKKRIMSYALEQFYQVSKYDLAILKLFQDFIELKKRSANILSFKQEFIKLISGIPSTDRLQFIQSESTPYIWGLKPSRDKSEKILNAINESKDIIFAEDAFLRCIIPNAQMLPAQLKHYQYACGYILDDLTAYFDATRPSRMEQIINSDMIITQEQINRAKNVIKKIIDNKISKYNNQPIYEPKIGRSGVPKILVIDQSYKDYSIIKVGADDSTFANMLNAAINENPDADIIIKTHPDTIGENSTKPKCYYQNVESKDNIYRLVEPINPISIIEYVDKVYVCTSQFGFEALMCGKEVHTFGMPFYAGWGLTIDAQHCHRRTRTRTLEEIFYIAYIYMALYINPITNKECEIEDAIDYLIQERNRYFCEEYNA